MPKFNRILGATKMRGFLFGFFKIIPRYIKDVSKNKIIKAKYLIPLFCFAFILVLFSFVKANNNEINSVPVVTPSLLQFTSANSIIGFTSDGVYVASTIICSV